MKELSASECLEEIKKLEGSKKIFVSISDDSAAKLELILNKKVAMESLFNSYINNTVEEAGEMNLKKFIDEYTMACIEYDSTIRKTLIESLGNEVYDYIRIPKNSIVYAFDYLTKTLSLFKRSVQCNLNK
jgi:prefoldin subunit 5